MDDVYLEIFKLCDTNTILNLSKTNKRLSNVYNNNKNSIYKQYLIRKNFNTSFIKNGNHYKIYKKLNFIINDTCPLKCIVKNNFLDVLQILPLKNTDYYNVSYYCCYYNNQNILEYIHSLGVDLKYNDDIGLRTASEHGHFQIVKYLLEKNSNADSKNSKSLRIACHNGHFDIVEILLKYNADISSKSHYSLRISTEKGYLNILKILINNSVHNDIDMDIFYRLINTAIECCYLKIIIFLTNKIKELNYIIQKEQIKETLIKCNNINIIDHFYKLNLLDLHLFDKSKLKNQKPLLKYILQNQHISNIKRHLILGFYTILYTIV